MKIIQCLTVMMTVVVYGASPPPKDELLRDIHAEAIKTCNRSDVPLDKYVTKPSGISDSVCVKHFFCLAEKALEEVPDKHKHVDKLIRLLKQYNEKVKDQKCVLNKNKQCTLQSLLEDIIKCSRCCRTPEKKKCECKNMKHKQ